MPRRLLMLNVALGIVSLAFAVGITRTLLVKPPMPQAVTTRPAPPAGPSGVAGTTDPGPEAYGVIAAQNLFSPARSETASVAAAPVVKPILHGVVVDGPKSRAFLEDPEVKRVSGYSVGDSVSGGRLQTIADDRVVIARPEGRVEVLLLDPSKPRPAPTAAVVPIRTALPGPATPEPVDPGQPSRGQLAPGQATQAAPPVPVAERNHSQAIPAENRARFLQGQRGQ